MSFERHKKQKGILDILTGLIAIIVIFFYIYTGMTSPLWDEGEYSGLKSAVEYIKNDARGINEHIIIGTTFREVVSDYAIYLSNFDASTIRIIETTGKYERAKYKINLEKIDKERPDYLIFLELKDNRYYFKGNVEREILKNYRIKYHFKRYFAEYYILKKTNFSLPDISFPLNGKNGYIYEDIFKESVPTVMKVGKPYTTIVKVKNTGDSRTNYYITLHYDKFAMYADEAKETTLDPGATDILNFKIVPFIEYSGELPIQLDLYVNSEDKILKRRVDSVSETVYVTNI